MKKDMKDIFGQLPLSSEAPQGLRNKVEFVARQRSRKSWFVPGAKWAAAAAAIAAGGFFLTTMLAPSTAQAKTWDMVTAAYQDVKGMLLKINFSGNDDDGSIQIATKGGEWHLSIDEKGGEKMDVSYSNGELVLWDGGDTAQVMRLGMELPFSPEDIVKSITDELTVSKILEKGADEIGRENIRIEQPTMVDGRRVYHVYISKFDGDEEGRGHMLVDADTDLPIYLEFEGSGTERLRIDFQFDGEFDDSLLRPVLPSGIKMNYMDIDSLRQMGGDGHDFDFDFDFGHDKTEKEPAQATIQGASIVR